MGNIVSLYGTKPIMTINERRNAGCPSSEEHMGPHTPNCPLATNTQKSGSFSWDNLISNLGGGITSIFGFLSKSKEQQGYQNYQQYQQQNKNNILWIGIAVVAVIVVVVIFATRKK
jgi:hypothetical protein